ncbi:HAD family hydrolase [Streptomyces sp. NPDC005808]|uniref:HAD family hydrolase n=1 Tax=Streptomyces sp. NPDC005808 TaxID=3364734 RepID=UPI00367CBE97
MNPSAPSLPFSLIATDLDGTLLRSDRTVGERTRAALSLAAARGARHMVVTGRSVAWTRHVLDDLGYTGLAVCGQGGQVYDAGAHRQLTSVTLDRRVARQAVARIESVTGPLTLAADRDGVDGVVVASPGYLHDLAGETPIVTDADADELWAAPVRKFYVQHPTLTEDELATVVERFAKGLVSVVKAGPGEVELLPVGLNKATGLSFAAGRLGLGAADTIAFGDMANDIPMLDWAAYGVAMAGAPSEVKEAADEVAPGNDEDGIAVVLERFLGSGNPSGTPLGLRGCPADSP